jgi:uncharacterized membrane protein YphA (DoxX/SURF4 family)
VKNYGVLILRLAIGGLFLTSGLLKSADPEIFFAVISELGFGAVIPAEERRQLSFS